MATRGKRGTGCVRKIGPIWYFQYYDRTKCIRKSSGSEVREVAEAKLADALRELKAGRTPAERFENLRYKNMVAALYADYAANGHKSLQTKADGSKYIFGVPDLDKFFGRYRAVEITTDRLRAFTLKRQKEGASNGTINRSLSALRRMFHLAVQDGKLRDVPYFPMLREAKPRTGFIERDGFERLRRELPEYMRPVLSMAFYTGMRLGEIKSLRWEHVNLLERKITLDADLTKNGQQRTIPLTQELPAMLELLRQQNPKATLVFTHEGHAIGNFRKVWATACVRAGLGKYNWICDTPDCDHVAAEKLKACPKCKALLRRAYEGLIFHDLRRAGVRNLVRAGVPESIAMKISGHLTASIFRRYDISSEKDMMDAGAKLDAFHEREQGKFKANSTQNASDAKAKSPVVN